MARSSRSVPTLQDRTAGVLLHPTSLPGRFGIGDLGPPAFEFLDFLERAGQRWWQMLPIGPAGLGNSPYQPFSAFAGNPLLISPDVLVQEDLLTLAEIKDPPAFSAARVKFGEVTRYKHRLLELGFSRFVKSWKKNQKFENFIDANKNWLEDDALFAVLRRIHKGQPWIGWQPSLRRRHPDALRQARRDLDEQLLYHKFVQFEFARQWQALKNRAAEKGVGLIGDLPIFVALDSADVWARPEIFRLNADGTPAVVAGVPPDVFSKTGQRWGNPLYDWQLLGKQKYAWWMRRFRRLFEMFDVVRLDHFIGFHRFWEIPAGEKTALKGKYIPGPGAAFFKEVMKQLPQAAFIAEDLGTVIPEVTALREQFHFPGMLVLQFAFGGDPKKNPYLPEKATADSVIYTGTHDNNTTRGWYEIEATDEEKLELSKHLSAPEAPIAWELIRMAYASAANTAIIPMQDVLGLDATARMNFPGKVEGNWKWRMEPAAIADGTAAGLQRLAQEHRRI
jgi:4-alpha-glucanotransferase